jgi:uncharacterized phage protein (TIGR01671 family)
MRKLKFRAWEKVEKKMLFDADPFALHVSGSNEPLLAETHRNENCIFEQYTGHKDKHGQEIYEGDIVEYTTRYYGNEKRHRKVVEWGEWDSDDFGMPHNLGYFDLSEYMEVIGNIHENPELLEAKNVD